MEKFSLARIEIFDFKVILEQKKPIRYIIQREQYFRDWYYTIIDSIDKLIHLELLKYLKQELLYKPI